MRRWSFIGLTAICLLIAACSSSTTSAQTGSPSPTATSTATPASTATTAPTATPTPSLATLPVQSLKPGVTNHLCYSNFAQAGDSLQSIGGIAIDISGGIALGYAKAKLPDNLPTSAPYLVNGTLSSSTSPEVNDDLGFGYYIHICNISSATTYILQEIGLQIATLAPYSNAKTSYAFGPCSTLFELPNQLSGGGCGGSLGPHQGFQATWPDTVAAGTAVTTKQTSTDPGPITGANQIIGSLPLTFKPDSYMDFYVGMTAYPPTNGTYTFTFGLQLSGYAMTYETIQTPALLLLPHATLWDGQYCQNKTVLQSQMKAGKMYICPQ